MGLLIPRRFRLWAVAIAATSALSACASVTVGEGSVAPSSLPPTSTTIPAAVESSPPTTESDQTETQSQVTETTQQAQPEPALSEPDPTTSADVYPVQVRITEIGVDAEIIDLGLNPDNTLEVPKDFSETGWYTGRSVPGNIGPSVVVGHVDSRTGPAVFYRLRDLEVGHEIEIDRSDGSIAVFKVTGTELVLKDEFPTEQVYGPTSEPTLRLITCGGDFDRSAISYLGNLIVYAEHLDNYMPRQNPYS